MQKPKKHKKYKVTNSRNKTSFVWQFFEKNVSMDGDKCADMVKCKICDFELKYNGQDTEDGRIMILNFPLSSQECLISHDGNVTCTAVLNISLAGSESTANTNPYIPIHECGGGINWELLT